MQYVSSLLRPERFTEALSFIPALSYPPEILGSALAGERLYDYRCSGCHGVSGRGDGTASGSLIQMPPADFTTDTLIAARNWEAVFRRIREGGRAVHGSSMPPWGIVLSEEETWDVVAFLATFQPGVLSRPAWAP
jgi:mono/diheme cytochrome c family protein